MNKILRINTNNVDKLQAYMNAIFNNMQLKISNL